jgi:hypothetical protein
MTARRYSPIAQLVTVFHGAFLGGLLGGCAANSQVVSLAEPTTPPVAKHYVDQVKRWTRRGDLLSDFDAAIIAHATFHSPEFRAAYIAKYIDVYKVDDSTRAQVVGAIPSSPDTYEFHLETETHTWEINELKPPKSIWRITLVDDKGREVSVQDVKLQNTRTELLQAFYPYTGIFSRAWRVLFPRKLADGSDLVTDETKSLTMRIAGPAGTVDLTWRLK